MGRPKKRGRKRKPRRDYQRERMMSKLNNPVGAPDPWANATSHGIVAFKNEVKRRARRGRSLIDRRTRAGQNALAVRDQMLADMGGESNLSTAKLALIEMIARDVYFLDECDRRIFRAIYKLSAKEKEAERLGKVKNPKVIGLMYSYRAGIARNLSSNLLALGLEKAPRKQKTLEEILGEAEEEKPEGEE